MLELPVLGGGSARIDLDALGAEPALAGRLVAVPSFVDLSCDPGFPGFPVRETPDSLAVAAAAGGFGALLCSPRVDPVVDVPESLGRLEARRGVRLHWAAALTLGLRGEALTEAGLLARAGAIALSDGGLPHRDTLVLRNALEYAREFDLPVLLRPADADLDAVGVVNDSPLATRLGLRGNPAAAEEIGVARAVALCRATGATVHLAQIGTAAAVDLVDRAQREGLPLSASAAARSLCLCEDDLDDGRYDAKYRLHPPLRAAADRAALVDAVRAGVLWLAADHAPRAPEEKDHEFERAVPGSAGLESAFAAAYTALGDLETVVRALATGPRSLLGIDVASVAILDPLGETTPPAAGGRHRSDALAGRPLRGRVLGLVPGA
jgi:dihydroorotase